MQRSIHLETKLNEFLLKLAGKIYNISGRSAVLNSALFLILLICFHLVDGDVHDGSSRVFRRPPLPWTLSAVFIRCIHFQK